MNKKIRIVFVDKTEEFIYYGVKAYTVSDGYLTFQVEVDHKNMDVCIPTHSILVIEVTN